jgi:hypothetical protein
MEKKPQAVDDSREVKSLDEAKEIVRTSMEQIRQQARVEAKRYETKLGSESEAGGRPR